MKPTQLAIIGSVLVYNQAKADTLNNITYQDFSEQCTKIGTKNTENNPELNQRHTECLEDIRAFSAFEGIVGLYQASLSEKIRHLKVGCLNLKTNRTFNAQNYIFLEAQLLNKTERAKVQYERLARIIEIKFPNLLSIQEYQVLKTETSELFEDTINTIENFECPYY